MLSRATAILDQLENASWFSRVGIDDGSSVAFVTSWPQAIENCSSVEWEDLQLEALNQYRVYIDNRSKERLETWNETVREVKKFTRPLVARKIATVVREHALPEIFSIQVNHDIAGFCMEAEYADVCPPDCFFTLIGRCYVEGHFPCGWWGVFPNGGLVVY
jgi:hypothetical protein